MLCATGTRQAVEERWGSGVGFNRVEFYALCEKYLKENAWIRNQVATKPANEVARRLIAEVVKREAIEKVDGCLYEPSIRGFITWVGGHRYFQPILNKVTAIVAEAKSHHQRSNVV